MTDRPTPTPGSTVTEPETPAAPSGLNDIEYEAVVLLCKWREASLESDASTLGDLTNQTSDFLEQLPAAKQASEAAALAARPTLDVDAVGLQLWNALLGCDDRVPVQGWSREHVVDHLRQAVEVAARLASLPTEPEAEE